MKQFIRILAVCLLSSCSKQHKPDAMQASRISVIYDITDSMGCRPEADPILSLYDFEDDREQAANFRLVLITDKLLNPVEEIHIEGGAVTEQQNVNEEIDYREGLVYSFYDAVRKATVDFKKHYTPSTSLKHSECFATIADELELLANSGASQKTLIVFSDLQENSDAFSCYTHQGQDLLQHNPYEVARLLQRRHSLQGNLQGVTVYFVYNPGNRDQDMRFAEMISIYKQLLHARGARVVIQATNKCYQP